MDKLEAMYVFVRIAEMGSFAGVARQMGLSNSVVTRQVAQLETALRVKLITRSTRSLTLTPAGAAYLEKCRVILDLVDAAETTLAEEREVLRGSLRISVPLTYGIKRLAPLLLEFAQQYNEVRLEMHYTDHRVNLIEGGIDLSIRITRHLADNDIVRKIAASRMKVIASPDYLAKHGCPEHPSDLIRHKCLSYSTSGGPEVWNFFVDGKLTEFPVRPRIQSNNGEALNEAAARGLGITCQPDFIVQESIATGRVKQILVDYPVPELGIYAVLPSNRQVPFRVRVLMDFLASRIANISADL
jgi:DNA-binding transcriptional LysR family regulator